MKKLTPTVALFLLGSGTAALVYQTAWERMLRLVFGASTAASSAVLAIFLGGLGLGGVWLGKRVEASERPLLYYGNLELGVACSAALTPFLVDVIAKIYWGLGGSGALGSGGATLVRLLLAALVLGPPVVLMGGTLPAAARAVEREDDLSRGELATLYATNTTGAVLGSLLGTFFLFELFGTRLSLWVAALLNALVAMLARRVGAGLAPVPVKNDEAGETPRTPADSLRVFAVYGTALVVGFGFLGLEIVWYRMLAPLLGGSSFTFGLILAVALAGIGIGSALYARRSEEKPATLSLLATTVALEAACAAFPLALGDDLAIFAAHTRSMAALGFGALTATWALIAAVAVLPPAIVAGYQFPVLFALLGSGRSQVARQVGMTYAFNTAGSIAGALLVGFVLLPRLGAVGMWRLVVAVLLALAVALLALDSRRKAADAGRRALLPVGFTLLALWMLTAEGPTAVSRHTPIGAGRVKIAGLDKNNLRDWKHKMRARMLWEKDGVESSLGVSYGGGLTFIVSGKADGAVFGDRGTQSLFPLIPLLLKDETKTAFVLGLGTGMSAGWLAAVPGVERVDVAELEPAIVEVAKQSELANDRVLDKKNVSLFFGDGREFLLTHERKYDIIASEPSNPYRAGVAALFTQDFYRVVARRLQPNGIFAQWLQAYEVDTATVRMVLATLRTVFPFIEAWQTQGGDLLLLAGMEPRVYDIERLRKRVREEPFRTILPRAGLIADAEGVLSRFLAGNALVEAIGAAEGARINTDDDNLLEYAFARNVGSVGNDIAAQLAAITQGRDIARPEVRGNVSWIRVAEQRARAWEIASPTAGPDLPIPDPAVRLRARAFGVGCAGDVSTAGELWFAQPDREPKDIVETYVLAQILAQKKEDRALELGATLAREGYTAEAQVIRGRYLAGKGKLDEALEALLGAITDLRKQALPLCDTARQAIDLIPIVVRGVPARAARAARHLIEAPLAVHNEEERRLSVAQRLAFISGDSALCVAALGTNLELPWWQLRFLAARAECLERAGHIHAARARADVAEWVAGSIGNIETGLILPPPVAPPPVASESNDGGVLEPEIEDGAADAPARADAAGDVDAEARADAGAGTIDGASADARGD